MNNNLKTLHVGSPNIGNREAFHRFVDDIFDRRWLTNNGVLVRELESQLEKKLGVRNCIAVCNGTIALEIAIKALELQGEVIVPSLTFIATVHALQWLGIKPVFCDVDEKTLCLNPNRIEELITQRTSAVLGVHVYGKPCDTKNIKLISEKHGIKSFYDAAHAFGCSHRNRMIGNFGECEIFSFHATKFFNTFEGGAITTNNDDLAAKIRSIINFGFNGLDRVESLGTNGKMTEICAGMGLTNLSSLDRFVEKNRNNYKYYLSHLENIPGLDMIKFNEREHNNWQYVVILVGEDYSVSRDEIVAILRNNEILVRKYFWPGCHRMEPYKSQQLNASNYLIVTEDVLERIVVLPTGTQMTEEDLDRVVDLLQDPRSHR